MNVLIVENEKKEALKLVRILRLADPSITVLKTLDDVNTLLAWMGRNPSPDLVLVNHAKYPDLPVQQQQVMAKLVLHTKQHNLTYLAFRANALQPGSAVPHPNAKGIPVTTPVRTSTPAGLNMPVYPDVPILFKNRFFVEQGQKFLSVPVDDIAYFFSDGRFVYFTTFTKNKYLVHYRIDELQQLLHPENFYRINRSFIISVRSIDQINPYFGGRFKLKLNPGVTDEILVSRKRVPGFKIWLGE